MKLRELGEDAAAEALVATPPPTRAESFSVIWPFQDKPWQHTAHAFGYIAPSAPSTESRSITYAGNIAADRSLQGARVSISLNRLRVANYPGRGIHRVLFNFSAQNHLPGKTEDLNFNATYRVNEGEHAGIAGYPIFVGSGVGDAGVAFGATTINVKNDDDERFLKMLDSDVMRAGLKLVNVSQPAIAPLANIALSLTRSMATRNRNVPVQDFYMGMDFAQTPTGLRLAEGAYLAVQIPESLGTVWDWDEWEYHGPSGMIRSKNDASPIPYNYICFGITRYTGE